MPWTILRSSFRSCQVELMACTSRCALPNSHLRADCQCLRCRICICVQAANVFAAEFRDSPCSRQPIPLTSFPAWPVNSIVQPMFVNNLRCRFSFNEPKLHKSALPIYPTVGMAANTLRHYFGQPAEVCTSCTFDTVTNHPHQKNPTPSSDRFEVPLHRICFSSHFMFLPTKPLALPTFNNNLVHRILSTGFKAKL